MQQFITLQAGRTPPAANVVDRADYKLNWNLTEFRANEYHLSIARYIPEHGWTNQSYFLTAEELNTIRTILNGNGLQSSSN